MCGLWGAVSRVLTPNELDNVQILADLSKYRGSHSTGVAFINRTKKNTKWSFQKRCIPSTFFLADKAVHDMFKEPDAVVVMGHCRAATIGDVTPQNAHPLHKGYIIGCHNGTISKYAPAKGTEATRSDSHRVFEMIRDHGIDHTIDDIGHDGAYALSWIDTKQNTLNFIRNGQRPLHFMWDTSHQTMYWASDYHYLDFMDRESSSVFGNTHEFRLATLYSIHYADNRNIAVTTREIKTKKVLPVSYPHSSAPWNKWGGFDGSSTHCADCRELWQNCNCWNDYQDGKDKETEEAAKPTVLELKRDEAKKPTLGLQRTAFCKGCRKKYIGGGCSCKNSKPYFPPEYEINDKGEWTDGPGVLPPVKPSAPPSTSVPVIGKSQPEVKRYPGWCKNDTYVGFRQQMLEPDYASKLLMTNGCSVCDDVPEVTDKAFFYSPNEFFCNSCKDKPEAEAIRGQRSTWLGTLHKASEGSKHVH